MVKDVILAGFSSGEFAIEDMFGDVGNFCLVTNDEFIFVLEEYNGVG